MACILLRILLMPLLWKSCVSEKGEDCGKFYRRPDNYKYGDKLDIVYEEPTKGIVKNAHMYGRIFWIINETCPGPQGCEITNTPAGPYEMKTINEDKYILRILYLTEDVDGKYRLQCTVNRTENVFTEWVEVKAPELKGCGKFYQRTHDVRLGGVMDLGYSLSPAIVNFTGDYTLIYRVKKSTCPVPNGCEIKNTSMAYQTIKRADNRFVLRILNLTKSANGDYGVQCTRDRAKKGRKDKYTNWISVTAPERPNNPILVGKKTLPNACKECIVGILGTRLTIKCNVSGGSQPLDVKIFVNGTNATKKKSKKIIIENVTLDLHETEVKCTVNNLALTQPLEASSKIYVAVKPALKAVVPVGMALDDESTYAYCNSQGGRPQGQLILTVVDNGTPLYNSSTATGEMVSQDTNLTLVKPKRNWNGRTIKCAFRQHLRKLNNDVEDQLIFKFSPKNVTIQPGPTFNEILPWYHYNLSCIVAEAYPQCNVSWSTPGIYTDTTYTSGEYVKTTVSNVSINVSRIDVGSQVKCKAICSGSADIRSSLHTIKVPYNPELSLNVSSVVNITKGGYFVAKCSVSSYPGPVIQWWNSANESMGYTCDDDSVCLRLQNVRMQDTGIYRCMAKNDLSAEITKSLTMYMQQDQRKEEQDNHNPSEDSTPVSYIILTVCIGVVLMIICITVFVIVKNKANKKKKGESLQEVAQRNKEEREARGNNESDSAPGISEEANVTYAVVSRPENRNAPNTTIPNTNAAECGTKKELIYADLDLSVLDESSRRRSRIIGTSDTENVQIDFNKKAAPLPDDFEPTEDAENIYQND